ncbi:MAG: AAA family ATPase [Limisphaerales bacterium]
MYLSKLLLANWRSYADAHFEFKRPSDRKPVVLIGAMNGHGKTSFLISLYLGLFGKFGLRYCEGFRTIADNDINSYRRALAKFRRSNADPDEPTVIDLTFTPTLNDRGEEEVRIIRRWFFTGSNQPRPGDGFEELEIHVGDRIIRRTEPVSAHERIEKELFPAHVAPAFFFDGEQAQALIEGAGEEGIRKAVNTMFGATILAELQESLRSYLTRAHSALGGRQKASEKQDVLNLKVVRQNELNTLIGKREGELEDLQEQRDQIDRDRNQLRDELARAGGGSNADAARIKKDFKTAEEQKQSAEEAVTDLANQVGLVLAVSRLDSTIRRRLRKEQLREDYENLRQGTLDKRERVLAEAMPEPAERDILLGNISNDTRAKVKHRILKALEAIYEPPDPDTAEGFLLGHVRGQQRARVLNRLNETRSFAYDHVRAVAKKLRDARDAYEEAKARHTKLGNQSEETRELAERIKQLDQKMDEAIRRIATVENEIKAWKADLHTISVEVGNLREELARLEPEQRRIAIADRAARTVEAVIEKLKPLTGQRLEDHVTNHFRAIADQRFRDGRITFSHDGEPHLQFDDGRKALLSSMSGFERRSFGIAFSLALAEITRRRVPLIIDTPLGNADSKYRPRTLDALRKFDCDQVIILTHDREVTKDLLEHIEGHVCQKFLVEFVEAEKRSVVHPNRFFFET